MQKRFSNEKKIPHSLEAAIASDYEKNLQMNNEDQMSAYSLVEDPKERLLKMRHHDINVLESHNLINAFLGSAIHIAMDKSNSKFNAVSDKHLHCYVHGSNINAHLKYYFRECLEEYICETVESYKSNIFQILDWSKKLNCLCYIARRSGYNINKILLNIILLDWDESRVGEDGYPLSRVVSRNISIMDFLEQEGYVFERIRLHRRYAHLEDDKIPDCEAEQRWPDVIKYCVCRNSLQRPAKVCDTMEEADQYIFTNRLKNVTIDIKTEKDLKCMKYCECKKQCDFWITKYN